MSMRFDPETIQKFGNPNFKFDLEIRYEESHTVACIVVRACNSSELPVAIQCTWKRIQGDRTYIIGGCKSNVYIPTCDDINAKIGVEVTAEESQDTAQAQVGPFYLDRKVRKNLEYTLAAGTGKFTLRFGDDLADNLSERNEALLEMTQDSLNFQVFKRDGSVDYENSFDTQFSVDYPQIILHPTDAKKLIFILNENNNKKPEDYSFNRKMSVRCLSKQSRDLIVMCIRCFALKNYLRNSKAITPENSSVHLELDSTLRELSILANQNYLLTREKKKMRRELRNMEKEMHETIEAYQDLLHSAEGGKELELKEEIEKLKHELDICIINKKKLRKKLKEKEEEINQPSQATNELKSALEKLEKSKTKNNQRKNEILNFKESQELAK